MSKQLTLTMTLQSFCMALFVAVTLITSTVSQSRVRYSIPEPKIEVFAKGFRVAIPDEDGVNLFAFHGNINIPMNDLEAGQYSQDVLKQEGNHWVFEDTNAKLKVGDVIYYWLFVIRFNLGFRYDNGKFVVKEIKPYKPLTVDQNPPSFTNTDEESNWHFEPVDKPSPAFSTPVNTKDTVHSPTPLPPTSNSNQVPVPTEHKPVSTCCQLFLNTTNQVSMLSEQIDNLMEENKILIQLAQKDEHYSTTLKVFGKYPTEYYPTPKDFVQNLVSEKLKLREITVVEAKTIPDNGISFKVETLKDKLKIILAGRVKLEGSNYELSW